jgi:hypothetical protein
MNERRVISGRGDAMKIALKPNAYLAMKVSSEQRDDLSPR